jgi:dCTP deaminase
MTTLSDSVIREWRELGRLKITPWNPDSLGSNSYDVHLGRWLAEYDGYELDAAKENAIHYYAIPCDGFVLTPGHLYLGVTREHTESHDCVPRLSGKSSVGRLGISVHVTAGEGDAGFIGHWTLEITAALPVRIYAGMPIGQITWTECPRVSQEYAAKASMKYAQTGGFQADPRPMPSRMHLNLNPDGTWR